MVELRIDNTPIDLNPDTKIEITASNPVLDPASVDRVFSFPFNVPLSPNNRRIRRHSQRLDARNRSASVPGQLRFDSSLILDARVSQTSVTDTEEEIVCANEPLEIWRRLGTIKINEILESIDLLDGETTPFWAFGLGSPGSYSITVDGTTATASAGSFGDIAAAGASLASQLNTAFPGIATYSSGSNTLTLDGFLVKDHPITAYSGITLNGYKNVALYHYNAVRDHVQDTNATPITTHCFPVIRWRGIYGSNNSTFENTTKYVNNAQDGTFYPNVRYQGDEHVWQNTVIPCVRVPYILSRIANALGGYTWGGYTWDDVQFQRLIVVNNRTLDEVVYDQFDDLDFYKLNAFQPTINLNLHVPAITAADFITALTTTFAQYLTVRGNQLVLVKKRDAVTNTPVDLTNLVSARFQSEPNRIDGWKLSTHRNDKETLTINDQLLTVQSAGGEHEVTTVNTLYWQNTELLINATYPKTPYTNQPGASPVFQSGDNRSTMPLCLLFCYELQETSDGSEYIFASHDNTDYDGNTVGSYTLAPDGDEGLYKTFHRDIIEAAVAAQLNVTAYLHIGIVSNLLTWKSARVRFYHPEGGIITPLVKSVEASAGLNGLEPFRLKLLL